MPKELKSSTTFDSLEDEILFTRAAMAADPDAEDLLPLTESWLGRVDDARRADRTVRQSAMEIEARRQVSNSRLDAACVKFGDELFLAVGKDRKSARWLQFFREAVSRFVRQALPAQVLTVQGWFASTDPVLTAHRPELERWATRADDALVKTRALAVSRGENWQRREELCAGLTRERDALEDALSERARERGLDRSWPSVFFRASRPDDDKAKPPAPEPTADPSC